MTSVGQVCIDFALGFDHVYIEISGVGVCFQSAVFVGFLWNGDFVVHECSASHWVALG